MNRKKVLIGCIHLLLALAASVALPEPSDALAQTVKAQQAVISRCSNTPNRVAENWISEQVAAGRAADLGLKFPAETDRVIRASFLQNLLTNSLRGLKVHRHGVHISHAAVCEPIDLDLAEIPFDTSMKDCYFSGEVSLNLSRFRKSLQLDNCIFDSAFDAAYADVAIAFRAPGAQFKQAVRFDSIKVGRNFSLEDAMFERSVDFSSAEIGGDFSVDRARFKGNEQTYGFESIKVGRSVSLRGATFEGSVDFDSAEIGGDFWADGVQFNGKEQTVTFGGMSVGKSAFFGKALFEGKVSFIFARINGNFEVHDSKFTSNEKEARFDGLNVKQHVVFEGTTFEAPVSFNRAEMGIFDMMGTRFDSDKKVTSFWAMRVDDFRLVNTTFRNAIDLEGLTYKNILVGSWDDLLSFIGQSEFKVDVYTRLENYYAQLGYQDRANDVYIARRRRERSRLRGLEWLASLFLDFLIGYGRRPGLALFWSVGFVILGWIVFRDKQNMVLQNKDDAPRKYNAFWYSFDLFLPIVQLEESRVWRPDSDYTFAWYAKVHRIIGWILIPLGLGAVTGIVK